MVARFNKFKAIACFAYFL